MGIKAAINSQHPLTVTGLSPATQVLIRKLVAQSSQARPPLVRTSSDDPESEQVLFIGEVDGVRCVLVKPPKSQGQSGSLSPREQEIARMIAKGYPNKTIAAVLDISVWTVCTHLRRIFGKLRVTSRAAMVAQLIKPLQTEPKPQISNGRKRLAAGPS